MSLTKYLKDSGSPVRAYVDGIAAVLADGRDPSSHAAAQTLNLPDLALSPVIISPAEGVDAKRSGAAIDFRARIALGTFDPHDSAAAEGVAEAAFYAEEVENGERKAQVLAEVFEAAVSILDTGSNDVELDRAAILLACCEQVHRGGEAALKGSLGDALFEARSGFAFALTVSDLALADVRQLMEANEAQLTAWRGQIARGERFEPNPIFTGSGLVGGADGDWIVGDTLFESKAYAELSVPRLRTFIRQLLGYVMLDLRDDLHIRSVGLWLPRQRVTRVWPLDELLDGNPDVLLPGLRTGFETAANNKGVAVRVPITQRRKEQVLADNRYTPPWMLQDLALSLDADIRMRVGRNAVTPEDTLRRLARDRYAPVREGVANNEHAPADLLDTLAGDSSVAVQRAASKNPRAPRSGVGLLEQAPPATQQPNLATSSEVVAVSAATNRSDSGLNTRWFEDFLQLSRGGKSLRARPGLPLPEASWRWGLTLGRSLEVPEWLSDGLPDVVLRDLLREGRPAWVRQWAARDLRVLDSGLRDRLLADPDPEIRWTTLVRTMREPDDAISGLLGTLAVDKKERTRFRTEGYDGRSNQWSTPAERDLETVKVIAAHPSTPRSALLKVMASKSPHVLATLAGNPALLESDLKTLVARLQAIRDYDTRERLAALSTIPDVVARALSRDGVWSVRAALARNGGVSVEVLSRLASDKEPYVRAAVVENANAPAELVTPVATELLTASVDQLLSNVIETVCRRGDLGLTTSLLETALDKLAKSRLRDPDLRCVAAAHEYTSAKTLARLAKSADEDVRRTVARNPTTPSEVLAVLATDAHPFVRLAAASNDALDVDLLAGLAYDDEPRVRVSVARNGRLDPTLIRELLHDKDRDVRLAALRNPSVRSDDKAQAEQEREQAWRAAAPSNAVVQEMVLNTRAEVRVQPAWDRRTTPDVLRFLAGDRRSATVRRAVAANPNAPVDVLASLADDKDEEVRQAVAFNGATPSSVLSELADRGIDLAILVALNPDTQPEILDRLGQDDDFLISYAARSIKESRALTDGAPGSNVQVLDAGPDAATDQD